MKKILVVYGSVGLGHKVVAENISAALAKQKDLAVVKLDVLEMYRGPLTETSAKIYEWIIKHTPRLWGFFYSNPLFLALVLPLRLPFAKLKIKKYREFVAREKPDLILTTHPTATALTINLKKLGLFRGPVVTTFSDFHFQPFWVYPGVSKYLVMTEEQQAEVMKRGFAEAQVAVTGLPVDPIFARDYEAAEVYQEFGLAAHRPLILLMGGSRGWGVRLPDIEALLKIAYEIQILVVAGLNSKLAKDLRPLAGEHPDSLKILSRWANNEEMAKLFRVAKILVTKPGGLTIGQALLANLPMVLVNPLPTMEQMNQAYLEKRGAAVAARDQAELGAWAERLLQDPRFYSELRQRGKDLAAPRAAELAARVIIDTLKTGG